MSLKSIVRDIKENYTLHIIMVLFCISLVLIVDGIFMDPLFGNQFIKTTIKIIRYNNSHIEPHYSFIFNENFGCKGCLLNNNICSYTSPCPNIIINNNYTYYCDCTTYTCGFKPYNYYTSNAFIVLISGTSILATIILFTLIICIRNIINKKNNHISPQYLDSHDEVFVS